MLEVRLRIGPIEKTLSREQVASIKAEGENWHVVDSAETHYVGALESASIHCVAGKLTFGGKSVRGIELTASLDPPMPSPGTKPARREPEARPEPAGAGPPTALADERTRAADLLAVATKLRDAYLERAAKLEKTEYQKFKEKYLPEYEAACEEVKRRADAYAKFAAKDDTTGRQFDSGGLGLGLTRTTTITKTGPAGEALQALELTEAKKRKLMLKIKTARDELAQVASARRDRIRAYCAAISRDLAAGKQISEEAMDKIYAQALAVQVD